MAPQALPNALHTERSGYGYRRHKCSLALILGRPASPSPGAPSLQIHADFHQSQWQKFGQSHSQRQLEPWAGDTRMTAEQACCLVPPWDLPPYLPAIKQPATSHQPSIVQRQSQHTPCPARAVPEQHASHRRGQNECAGLQRDRHSQRHAEQGWKGSQQGGVGHS